MKYILFIAIGLNISLNLQAEKYALHFCKNVPENKAIEIANLQGLETNTFLQYNNVLIVESNSKPYAHPEICFISQVKTIENHFAFNTNQLIVRANNAEQIEEILDNLEYSAVTAHPFIPNQVNISFTSLSETELLNTITGLQAKFKHVIFSTNQVFTIKTTVNDPLFNRQWSIENNGTNIQGGGTPDADMQVDSAWNITTGDSNIKIAILDSGVDTLHEDLINNLLPGYDGFGTDSFDTKGYPTPNYSNDGHGTACAGIVAAVGDNNLGVAGIAYDSKIIPVRIFYYQDYGAGIGIQATTNTEALVNGSAYAWRVANCDIMSTSAGLSDLFIAVLGIDVGLVNAEIEEAFYQGRNGKGVAMFFSAGNDDIDDVLWPGDLPQTIAVGASTMCDERKNPNDCSNETWGSSYGQMLDIVAPGTLIASTDMTGNNGYNTSNYTNTFNGTSAACPNAAGVGALLLSVNDNLHARDIKTILNTTAQKVDNYAFDTSNTHGSWNEEVGYGRVNAFEAVTLAQTFQSTVGLSTISENIEINIYPNPSFGNINLKNGSNKLIQLDFFDTLGSQVVSVDVAPNSKENIQLKPGIYFVQVEKWVEKIIVK